MRTPETPLTYILTDVNTKERTAIIKVRELGKRSGYKIKTAISGQIASRVQMYRDNTPTFSGERRMKLEDVEFTSTLQSKSFQENPLKLIKFIKDDVVEFNVQLVSDKGFKVFKYRNAAQKMVDKVVYMHWKATEYIRYWEVDLTSK